MAQCFPSLEQIKKLKVSPTNGEWYLLNHLINNLPNEVEIYFQPFLNGDMPDIILMQKDVGVTIIEIKDWDLNSYKIDEKGEWFLRKDKTSIKSPFQQVKSYRKNLFNIHITGLLEAKIRNKKLNSRIETYVYLHKANKQSIDIFYSKVIDKYHQLEQSYHSSFKNKILRYDEYNQKLDNLKKEKKYFIENDMRYHLITNNSLQKITLPKGTSTLFTESIYKEFHRYLQPPYHTLEQGIELQYTKEQLKFIESKPIHEKIRGVAGSGKTVVLAKRTVNAHKRHNHRVLVLTYNITLRSYIHDKISDVRENFSWGNFYITNYHQFINQLLNNLEVKFEIPDTHEEDEYIQEYFDKEYYSNRNLFEKYKTEIPKYHSIFIDEIQDYKPSWIKIIREYFLEEDGEMVLFGDEKQNIYDRELDSEQKPKIVQGFGRWKNLTKSIRDKSKNDRIINLAKSFQQSFFEKKYEIDKYEKKISQPSLSFGLYKITHYQKEEEKLNELVDTIFKELQSHHTHNDDVVILASKVSLLKEIDYILRTKYKINTLTTFETKEMGEKAKHEIKNIRKYKKIAFNQHSGKLKISTIHSFKGCEAHTVFLIIDDNNEYEISNDNPEMVYTGITRSTSDIMVFTIKESQYNKFFFKELEKNNINKDYLYDKKSVENLTLSIDNKLFYSRIGA